MAAGRVRLLFDEDFSHKHVYFVNAESRLAAAVHIRKIGWSGWKDVTWIPLAVQQGFTIVTSDRNDRKRGFTVGDLKALGAQVIMVGPFSDHITGWERAKWLVNRFEQIVETAEGLPTGSVVLLNKQGKARDL